MRPSRPSAPPSARAALVPHTHTVEGRWDGDCCHVRACVRKRSKHSVQAIDTSWRSMPRRRDPARPGASPGATRTARQWRDDGTVTAPMCVCVSVREASTQCAGYRHLVALDAATARPGATRCEPRREPRPARHGRRDSRGTMGRWLLPYACVCVCVCACVRVCVRKRSKHSVQAIDTPWRSMPRRREGSQGTQDVFLQESHVSRTSAHSAQCLASISAGHLVAALSR